jgi:hypothetical protein
LQKTWLCAAKFQFGRAHRTVRWCTRHVRLVRVNSPLSGFDGGVRLKFTGLSGEPTVASANGRLRNLRATRGSSNGRQGALSGVHRRMSGAPTGQELQRLTVPNLKWQSRTEQATVAVRWRTRLSGAPLDRRQGWPSKFASNGS